MRRSREHRPVYWLLAAAIGAILASAALTAAPAAADEELRLQVYSVDTSAYPQVSFIVSVADGSGRPVHDLEASNFSLSAANKTIPVSGVDSQTNAQLPISALLVLDISGSMAGAPILAARQAATQFVDSLQPADEVGVLGFSDSVVKLSDYSANLANARTALAGLQALGNTALYQAATNAATAASQREAQRRVVLLLSDGADFGAVSRASREESLAAAQAANVPFYVIGLGTGVDQAYLQQLSDLTGGAFFIAPDSSQLKGLYAQISELLRSQYVLTLDLSNSGLGGETKARLTVRSGALQRIVDVTLRLPALPAAVPQPAVEREGASRLAWVPVVLPALALLVAAALIVRWLARRFQRTVEYRGPELVIDGRGPGRAAPGETRMLGRLVLSNGQVLPLEREVISLGAEAGCSFKLPASVGDFGPENVRIWTANGRVVVHDLAARPRVELNGRRISWAYLRDGDVLEVGGQRMRFESLA